MEHQFDRDEYARSLPRFFEKPVQDEDLDDARIKRIEEAALSLARRKAHTRKRFAAVGGGAVIAALALGAVTPAVASRLNFDAVVELFAGPDGDKVSPTPVATYIDPSAKDFEEWAAQGIDISRPVPPGVDPREIAKKVTDGWAQTAKNTEGGALIEPGVAQAGWDINVSCLWIDEWLHSYEMKDQVAIDVATKEIVESPDLTEDDGGNSSEWREYADALGERIRAHDVAAVEEWRIFLSCGPDTTGTNG